MVMTSIEKDMFDHLSDNDKGFSQAVAVLFQYVAKELGERDILVEDLQKVAKKMEKLHYLITSLLENKERGSK